MLHCRKFLCKYNNILSYVFILSDTPLFKQLDFEFLECVGVKQTTNTEPVDHKKTR